MKMVKILLILLITLLLADCAGARNLITAHNARYDISLSGAIRDSIGNVIPSNKLEKVGTYEQRAYGWGILWTAVSLNSIDISDSVNAQVTKAGGSAIIKLAVNVQAGKLNSFPILNWLPIWPGYNIVDLYGDIVRIKKESGDSSKQSN